MDTLTIPDVGVFTYTPFTHPSTHPYGFISSTDLDATKPSSFKTIFGLELEISPLYYFAELFKHILHVRPGVQCTLAKWNLLKSLFDNKLDFWDKRYIIPMSGELAGKQYSPHCKEEALSAISKHNAPYFYVVEKFNLQQRRWLREIQSFLPTEDRCKIIFDPSNPGYLKVEIAEWWFTQPFYRLGWLLLALRIANERETISGKLKEKFDNFSSQTMIPAGT